MYRVWEQDVRKPMNISHRRYNRHCLFCLS